MARKSDSTTARQPKAPAPKPEVAPKTGKSQALIIEPITESEMPRKKAKAPAAKFKPESKVDTKIAPVAAPKARKARGKAPGEISKPPELTIRIDEPLVDPIGDTTDGEARFSVAEEHMPESTAEMNAYRADAADDALEGTLSTSATPHRATEPSDAAVAPEPDSASMEPKPGRKTPKKKTKAAAVESAGEPATSSTPDQGTVFATPKKPRKEAKAPGIAASPTQAEHEDVDASEESGAAESGIPPKLERLQKILSQAGIASRRHAEEMIEAGRVIVNGQPVTQLGAKADPARDHIRVDGKLIQGAERHRYFVLNKPKGYVTTASDPEGRPTVMHFFEKMQERLYPVGRLDFQSEGLLLVTNDGDLANRLTQAASGVEKTYLVKVAGQPSEAEMELLRSGVPIERDKPGSAKVPSAPAQIKQIREGDNPWYEVVLIEGRNRELRKMFLAIGHHVEKIRRVGYGPLVLDLEPGKLRELDPEELAKLRLAAEGKWKPRRPSSSKMLPKAGSRHAGARDARSSRVGGPGSADRRRPSGDSRGEFRSKPSEGDGFRGGAPRSAGQFDQRRSTPPDERRSASPDQRRSAPSDPRRSGPPSFRAPASGGKPFREGTGWKPREPRFDGGKNAKFGGKPSLGRPQPERFGGRSNFDRPPARPSSGEIGGQGGRHGEPRPFRGRPDADSTPQSRFPNSRSSDSRPNDRGSGFRPRQRDQEQSAQGAPRPAWKKPGQRPPFKGQPFARQDDAQKRFDRPPQKSFGQRTAKSFGPGPAKNFGPDRGGKFESRPPRRFEPAPGKAWNKAPSPRSGKGPEGHQGAAPTFRSKSGPPSAGRGKFPPQGRSTNGLQGGPQGRPPGRPPGQSQGRSQFRPKPSGFKRGGPRPGGRKRG